MARDNEYTGLDDPLATEVSFSVTPAARQMAAIVRRDEPDGVWRCRYCRVQVVQLDQPWGCSDLPFPERDHIVPRKAGGSNALANLALACSGCNVRKGARDLSELPAGWQEWREHVRAGRPEQAAF